jgi:hypothetical protein
MKKIDILNFITDFRKSPNSIKTYREIINHLGSHQVSSIDAMLDELQRNKVVKLSELNGEKAYQVISR